MAELTPREKLVLRRALSGYAQWCRDRAVAAAQKTSPLPTTAVAAAFAEEDAANDLYKLFIK